MNPFDVLEITPDASPEDIKAAYHRLAKQWHPNRYTGDAKVEAEEKFRELAEAFSTLKDPGKRLALVQQMPKVPAPPPPPEVKAKSADASQERTPEDWADMARKAFDEGRADQAQALSTESAGRRFLSLLDERQRSVACFRFEDEERFDWGYVPRSRKGVGFKDLSPGGREAALAMLRAALSEQGYAKATGIIQLEGVLRELEGRDPTDTFRSPLEYYVSIFGTPGDSLWGWRLEGHHLSLNFSSQSRQVVSGTPAFWGANPAVVPGGPEKGKQVLHQETELGFRLINSLDAGQRVKALFSEDAPPEIITGNDRAARSLEPRGIGFDELTRDQQDLLMRLLRTYIDNYDSTLSDSLMQKVQKAGLAHLHFGWAGSLKPGKGHYYRIQGPSLLIEYDNTQDKANHVHAVVRDLTNDFGLDVLREHYARDHHK